jgi:hypothetical protein
MFKNGNFLTFLFSVCITLTILKGLVATPAQMPMPVQGRQNIFSNKIYLNCELNANHLYSNFFIDDLKDYCYLQGKLITSLL